jgi:Asp/Glu/hydantoin racemase
VRLLLINPNTTTMVTDRVVRAAQERARPQTQVTGATGRFGARYITTRASAAVAGHAALDAYAEYGAKADVVGLACFGDPGLLALREVAHQPVVGMAEASCLLACTLGRRFAIVTGGERWGPMLEEFVAGLGLADRLAGVVTVRPTGGDIARDPDAAVAPLAAGCLSAVSERGADVVILGGAGLVGLAGRLADRVPVPVIDCVAALITACEAIGALGVKTPTVGTFAPPPAIESVGLSPSLSARLGA